MQVSPVNVQNFTNNNYNYRMKNSQPQFTGAPVDAAEKVVTKSKLFNPFKRAYAKMVFWLVDNYYTKLATSKLAAKFIDVTKKIPQEKADMTKHMSVLGATLISGMYIVKTLQNDKLDKEKRKTLAINDAMTWGIATALGYSLDKYLDKWCNKLTTRYAANYFLKNPEAKNIELLGDWKPENVEYMLKYAKNTAIIKNRKMKAKLSEKDYKKWLEKINMKEKHFEYLRDFDIKSISDLNTQLLKDERLDRRMKGMGVLKSLLVFGMVYRYLVPVLIMKPANKIGAYIHKKNEEKAQAQQAQKA